MKITLKEISSVSQEIALDLDWSDIENDFEKSIKSFSKKIKISGFRPGRVPRKILMDRFQPSIESEFIENSVNQYYLKALKEKRIAPVNMGSVSCETNVSRRTWDLDRPQVEEKFPEENFRVNREMRDEILVYESILSRF